MISARSSTRPPPPGSTRISSRRTTFSAGCSGASPTTKRPLTLDLQGRHLPQEVLLRDLPLLRGSRLHADRSRTPRRGFPAQRLHRHLGRRLRPYGHRDSCRPPARRPPLPRLHATDRTLFASPHPGGQRHPPRPQPRQERPPQLPSRPHSRRPCHRPELYAALRCRTLTVRPGFRSTHRAPPALCSHPSPPLRWPDPCLRMRLLRQAVLSQDPHAQAQQAQGQDRLPLSRALCPLHRYPLLTSPHEGIGMAGRPAGVLRQVAFPGPAASLSPKRGRMPRRLRRP